MNKLEYNYDPHNDVLIINGVKYSGDAFRTITSNKGDPVELKAVGDTYTIDKPTVEVTHQAVPTLTKRKVKK